MRILSYACGLIAAGMLLTRLPLMPLQTCVQRILDNHSMSHRAGHSAASQASKNISMDHQAPFFALWGGVIALLSLVPAWAMVYGGVPSAASMIWAVLAAICLSGALHEDGLADCADGWFASASSTRRREIMKDPRTGSFGALALIFSVLLRLCPLMLLPWMLAMPAFIAAHVLGRGLLPLGWDIFAAKARQTERQADLPMNSLAAQVPGKLSSIVAALMTLLLLIPLWWVLPPWVMIAIVIAAWMTIAAVLTVSLYKIGMVAGDSLGAAEQCAEIAVIWTVLLLCLA